MCSAPRRARPGAGTRPRARGMTPYALAKASGGVISLSAAYRLAEGEFRAIGATVMDSLCEILNVEPGELFERTPTSRRRSRGR